MKPITISLMHILLIIFSGILYALGFPTKLHGGNLLTPILGFAILFYFLEIGREKKNISLKKGLLYILLFSAGYNIVGYYWIPHVLSEFGEIHSPFNHLLGLVFSLIIAPQLYVFYLCERKLSSYYSKLKQYKIVILALLYILVEQIVPQQFPAHLGHPWLTMAPYLGFASLFGAPFYSLINAFIVLFISQAQKEQTLRLKIAVLSIIILNFALPKIVASSKVANSDRMPFNIRFVQGNIGNFLKLSSESGEYSSISQVIKAFKDLSSAPSEKPLDLILWPETSYPLLLNTKEIQKGKDYVPNVFYEIVANTNAEVFFGGYDQALSGHGDSFYKSEYNAAFHINAKGELKDTYHKMKLIPFGESLPFGPFNSYLSKFLTNIAFFAQGEAPKMFTHHKNVTFTSAICYEILFTNFIRSNLNHFKDRPEIIVNLTNDSWYGDTSEPLQHLFLSKWRALEFSMPILRMTNTGITSVIYEDGSESRRLGVGEKNFLDIEIYTKKGSPTFYQRFGLLGTIIVSFLFLMIQIRYRR